MSYFIINGPSKLEGEIKTQGAKNSALKLMAASLLIDNEICLENIPEVEDIKRIGELIKYLGGKIEKKSQNKYKIEVRKINTCQIDQATAKRLRASIVLTGPILARYGKAIFPHPGGCVIGKRPIDIFIDGFKSFGADIKLDKKENYVVSFKKRPKGIRYFFRIISVTATENMILLAATAKGKTILKNAACEPEVVTLAEFLNQCGAKIKGAGTPFIEIEGVNFLKGGKFKNISDRIEAGSFAILAAATNSQIKITNCNPEYFEILLVLFEKIGVDYKVGKNWLMVKRHGYKLKSCDLTTHEYPGFATDLQAPFVVLMTQAKGRSLIHETIYNGRLFWINELIRMGAEIFLLDPHRAMVFGPAKLRGREIESPDIRAGMAFIIAAACAKGKTIINNAYQIDRGYEKIEKRLKNIGMEISRIG